MLRILLFLVFVLTPFLGSSFDTLRIEIGAYAQQQLLSYREQALQQNLITQDLKKKFPATLKSSKGDLNATIRFKGDWTDHLKSDKWSYRIKLKSGDFKGLKHFSIQHPNTRGDLFEFAFHQLLEKEGIPTTYYDFVVVYINGENKGVYALEEHFTDDLLERNGLPSGPILKFDETAFWEFQDFHQKTGEQIHFEYPLLEKAIILPFGSKKIAADSERRKTYLEAQNKLHTVRQFQVEHLDSLIDINLTAKYFALCDVVQSYHGLRWHNQRFYYHPEKRTLLPIAYDCWEPNKILNREYIGMITSNSDSIYFADVYFEAFYFNHPEFKSTYLEHLKHFKQADFVQTLVQIDSISQSIASPELPCSSLVYRWNKFHKLPPLDSYDQTDFYYYPYEQWKRDNPNDVKVYDLVFPVNPFSGIEINARVIRTNPSTNVQTVRIEKTCPAAIELTGYYGKTSAQDEDVILNGGKSFHIVELPAGYTKLAYKVVGLKQTYSLDIIPFPAPETIEYE